jgi:3-hydroxyisobutyrate dehydrogenase
MHIGIAGTGKMGTAVANRLASTGEQVTVWNRSSERARPLLDAGVGWAASPRELVARAEVIITLLTDEKALDDVYLSPQGLLSAPAAGKTFIEMSTVPPALHVELAARAAAVGAAYIECPVGGSVGPAKEGKLIGFVGGGADDLARVRPVLDKICRRVEHVGGHGAGAAVKLAVNLPLMVYWQTLGEALSLIEPLGLDPKRVIDILSDSSGGPNMLKVRGGMIAQALAGEAKGAVTVDVATMRKDVRTMLDFARSQRRRLPLTEETLRNFERAAGTGLDGADCAQLPVWWLREGGKA